MKSTVLILMMTLAFSLAALNALAAAPENSARKNSMTQNR
jgi:hypothetical protein